MATVEILPRYRALLTACGRTSARTLLDWTGVILSGHPRRHVLRVVTGAESFILKKEHRVPWRDRLANAWAGFGWSSKSVREARLLMQLQAAGVPCPDVVAFGADGSQAFLLLREEAGLDLREYLSRLHAATECQALAEALGRALARIHGAGFTQPDLYAKHVLVRPGRDGFRFCFIDWQRSRRLRHLSWRHRLRDLAALDTSLASELASDRLRLACLRAYLSDVPCPRPSCRSVALAVRRLGERRRAQRRMRELRQPPLAGSAQQLLWLQEDERLCIARDFYEELGGRLPSWLPQAPAACLDGSCVSHRLILLGTGRTGHLVERWRRAAGWLPRGKYPAPEMERAAALFRLQRFGVAGPRLLAMGHRQVAAWQRYSFLLTEPPVGLALGAVLRRGLAPAARHPLLRELGVQLRQMHEAGFTLRPGVDLGAVWVVASRLALANIQPLQRTRAPWPQLAAADLGQRILGGDPGSALPFSRADALRILLAYLRLPRLDADARQWIAQFRPLERRVAR